MARCVYLKTASLWPAGELKDDLTAWDALRSTLPVGTISGAPKVRAMEIIDEMETKKRGPYGGGIGFISFSGELDIALALRTMVYAREWRHRYRS